MEVPGFSCVRGLSSSRLPEGVCRDQRLLLTPGPHWKTVSRLHKPNQHKQCQLGPWLVILGEKLVTGQAMKTICSYLTPVEGPSRARLQHKSLLCCRFSVGDGPSMLHPPSAPNKQQFKTPLEKADVG